MSVKKEEPKKEVQKKKSTTEPGVRTTDENPAPKPPKIT